MTNGKGALAWAFGRVSLWGRIVEHVDGWRAEYAYPYEITVYGPDELAAKLRSLYGIDVECRAVDELPRLDEADEEEVEEVEAALDEVSQRLASLTASLNELRPTEGRKRREAPRYLWNVLWYDDQGRRRRTGEALRFIEDELRTEVDARGRPVMAQELVEGIMLRAGGYEYVYRTSDASSIGADLFKLAMRRDVVRLRSQSKATVWATRWADVPSEYEQRDPTLEHLERDVAMAVALYRANGGERASAAEITAQLSLASGELERSQKWSGSFVRLQQRGWMKEVDRRTYELTNYGKGVARLGRDLPLWGDDRELVEALERAVLAEGTAVTFESVAWQFRTNWDARSPSGHNVSQRLLRLEREGVVTSERRPGVKHLLWRPVREVTQLQAA
jgi:hypothetical protein